MAKIGVGIVGCGGMGASLARGLGELETAEIVACYDAVAEKAAALAETTSSRACVSYDELLGDEAIQAVAVASPQFAHAENTSVILAAGPCGSPDCRRSRADALLPLLESPKLDCWTHLVTDDVTGNDCVTLHQRGA